MTIEVGPGKLYSVDPVTGDLVYLGEIGPMEFAPSAGLQPVRMVLGEPVIDYEPGWSERVGAIGYPDAREVGAEELATDVDEGYCCGHCRRGHCAQCTDRACTCCAGYPDPDE